MNRLSELENIGTNAVKKLREHNLINGQPFMINSNSLPSNQCYLEFPDGSIVIAKISDKDFVIIQKLSPLESDQIRLRFNLAK